MQIGNVGNGRQACSKTNLTAFENFPNQPSLSFSVLKKNYELWFSEDVGYTMETFTGRPTAGINDFLYRK